MTETDDADAEAARSGETEDLSGADLSGSTLSDADDDELTFETPDGATMLDSDREYFEVDDGDNDDGTVTVPETFTPDKWALRHSSRVPDEWDTQMVFERNDVINACAIIDSPERSHSRIWINAMYQTEETRPFPGFDLTGWIVYRQICPGDKTLDDVVGETLWRVDD